MSPEALALLQQEHETQAAVMAEAGAVQRAELHTSTANTLQAVIEGWQPRRTVGESRLIMQEVPRWGAR